MNDKIAPIPKNFCLSAMSWLEGTFALLFNSVGIPTFLSKTGLKYLLGLNRDYLASELVVMWGLDFAAVIP